VWEFASLTGRTDILRLMIRSPSELADLEQKQQLKRRSKALVETAVAMGLAGKTMSICAADGCAERGELRCSRCKAETYCSKACQKRAWKAGHKKFCQPPTPKAAAEGIEKEKKATARHQTYAYIGERMPQYTKEHVRVAERALKDMAVASKYSSVSDGKQEEQAEEQQEPRVSDDPVCDRILQKRVRHLGIAGGVNVFDDDAVIAAAERLSPSLWQVSTICFLHV
jgi:hypothetical protein